MMKFKVTNGSILVIYKKHQIAVITGSKIIKANGVSFALDYSTVGALEFIQYNKKHLLSIAISVGEVHR